MRLGNTCFFLKVVKEFLREKMFWGPQFVLGVNAETPSRVVEHRSLTKFELVTTNT